MKNWQITYKNCNIGELIKFVYIRELKVKETLVYNSSANLITKGDFHFFHYIKTLIMVLFFE